MTLICENPLTSDREKINGLFLIKAVKENTNIFLKVFLLILLIAFWAFPEKYFSSLSVVSFFIFILKLADFVFIFKFLDNFLFNEFEIEVEKDKKSFLLRRVYFFEFLKRKYFMAYVAYLIFFFVLCVFFNIYGILFLFLTAAVFLLTIKNKILKTVLKFILAFEIVMFITMTVLMFYSYNYAYDALNILTVLIIITFIIYVLENIYSEWDMFLVFTLKDRNLLYYIKKDEFSKD